ncbi:hypothetical protein CYG49_02405 [Candidatus Saccharibacteria bacterium]|nr:MAG: hypothetical protein CYG49_02405 [Candidatus Saccharibacteria bacterium]
MFRRTSVLATLISAVAFVAPATPASATHLSQPQQLPVVAVSADKGPVLDRFGKLFTLSNGSRVRVSVNNTCENGGPITEIIVRNLSFRSTPDLTVSVSDGMGRGMGGSSPIEPRSTMSQRYNLAQQNFGLFEGSRSLVLVNANLGYEYGCDNTAATTFNNADRGMRELPKVVTLPNGDMRVRVTVQNICRGGRPVTNITVRNLSPTAATPMIFGGQPGVGSMVGVRDGGQINPFGFSRWLERDITLAPFEVTLEDGTPLVAVGPYDRYNYSCSIWQ